MRPVIAAAALLGVALLTACDSGDPPTLDPTLKTSAGASSPIVAATGAAGRWQKLVGECPPIPSAAAAMQPGKPSREATDNSIVLNVHCEYAAAEGDSPELTVNVAVYRVGTIDGSADQLATANLAKNKRDADTVPDPTVIVETLTGVGDAGFASLLPGKGVRLYAQSGNAVVLVEYADPGDSRRNLATAQTYAKEVLGALQ